MMRMIQELTKKVMKINENQQEQIGTEVRLSETVDNYFVDKTGKSDEITLNCGSPSSLAGNKVIERYLKKNNIKK